MLPQCSAVLVPEASVQYLANADSKIPEPKQDVEHSERDSSQKTRGQEILEWLRFRVDMGLEVSGLRLRHRRFEET